MAEALLKPAVLLGCRVISSLSFLLEIQRTFQTLSGQIMI